MTFATNDERTAKRISETLGTATELRAQRNYAGHRLAPWLGHLMVSRQETARPLLTPGEVMQLPASDELVLVSGLAPIRAKKLRYYQDRNFMARILPAPDLGGGNSGNGGAGGVAYADRPDPRPDDWGGEVRGPHDRLMAAAEEEGAAFDEESEGGLQQQRHPGLPDEQAIPSAEPDKEISTGIDDDSDEVADRRAMDRLRGLTAVQRAYGINEGTDRGDDLLPNF